MSANSTTPQNADLRTEKTLTTVVYALQALTFLVGITYFIAPAINYYKQAAVAGTWLESHFRWQLNTFWYSLILGAVGAALLPLGMIGFMLLSIDAMWVVFRIVQGWSRLGLGNPMQS